MTQERNKVQSKEQVEEIWLADQRLQSLSKFWLQALMEGDFAAAKSVELKCERIKEQMLKKYDVIL